MSFSSLSFLCLLPFVCASVVDANTQTDMNTCCSPPAGIHTGSSDTVHSGIQSILDTPIQTVPPGNTIAANKVSDATSVHSGSTTSSLPSTGTGPVLRKNKVEPAVLTYESDAPANGTGASGTGTKPAKKSGPLPGRANRVGVAPPVEKMGEIPAENLVMCSVEIHSVKGSSPAPVSQKDSLSPHSTVMGGGRSSTRQDNATPDTGLAGGPSSPHVETTAVWTVDASKQKPKEPISSGSIHLKEKEKPRIS